MIDSGIFRILGHSHCLGGSTSAGGGGGGVGGGLGGGGVGGGGGGGAGGGIEAGDQQQRLSQLRNPRQQANTGSCASNR